MNYVLIALYYSIHCDVRIMNFDVTFVVHPNIDCDIIIPNYYRVAVHHNIFCDVIIMNYDVMVNHNIHWMS